jgi:hypothetical protein
MHRDTAGQVWDVYIEWKYVGSVVARDHADAMRQAEAFGRDGDTISVVPRD